MRAIVPSRSILLLMGIGLIDLVSTAWFHSQGMIVEMNPLMRVVLDHGEWPFILVKGATLIAAWIVMARYAQQNRPFVRKWCIIGSAVYLSLWLAWFMCGRA